MEDYILFIDTEASGLPKNWNLPYEAKNNWPYCVQISWVIYSKAGEKIKEENFYINNNDFTITKSAKKIHGITEEFLRENGVDRSKALIQLVEDVNKFQPLVAGHFMEFDLHMLGADFYRVGIENPIKKENTFCTMLGTRALAHNPSVGFLRLGQLYETLFNKPFQNHHNAIEDAKATALCFFELLKLENINEEIIELQQQQVTKKDILPDRYGCFLSLLVLITLTVLIFYL